MLMSLICKWATSTYQRANFIRENSDYFYSRLINKMVKSQILSATRASPVILTRCKSSVNRKKNGRETWHARQVPTGQTQYANFLVKIGNRKIWREREEFVNSGWKQTLVDVSQNREQLETRVAKDPHKLFMVKRVKSTSGRPYWEKDYIAQLGLKEDDVIQVIPNTQTNSGLLKKVNHLLEILPITFPYGVPQSEDDLEHSILCDNGEFIFKKRINTSELKGIETTSEIPDDKWQMSQELLDETLELKKQKHQINQEYFPAVYDYKRNEDGKEKRYKGNTNIGNDKTWY